VEFLEIPAELLAFALIWTALARVAGRPQ